MLGAGVCRSVPAAQKAMKFTATTIRPSKDRAAYDRFYADWKALLPKLAPFYAGQ